MIKIKFKRKLNQLGDTIPEVLICLAILGLTIVSAYTLTNRSQTVNRSAQERTEALKLADGQLELLKAYTDTHSELPKNDYFCLMPEAGEIKVIDINSDLSGDPDAIYPNNCLSGDESRFSYAIWSPDKASDTEIGGNGSSFAIIVRWEGFFSAVPEEVKTFYAIYEGSSTAFVGPGTALEPVKACSNGGDDNDDFEFEGELADADDPACHTDGDRFNPASYNPDLNSEINPECIDGQDNDSDGKTDYPGDNYGCENRADDDETDPVCYDGKDNDGDGKTDYTEDPSCEGDRNNDDEKYPVQCSDGVDNDRDGHKDFPDDASCSDANDDDERFPLPPARDPLYACYFWNEYVPYVGWKNLIRTNHRYTTNLAECNGAGNGPDLIGYVPKADQPGVVPMYGGFHAGIEDDFYTTSWGEYATAYSWGWTGGAGVKFYVYPDCTRKGTIGLYRWYSGFVGNHVYMFSGGDPNNFSPVDGGGTFVYEGLAGCILAGTYP